MRLHALVRCSLVATALLIAAAIRPAAACCQLGGTSCGDPFAVSCNNGIVCFPPYLSCPGCTCTATNEGHMCLVTASEPGTVPTLRVNKNAQNAANLDFGWDPSCASGATDYSVLEGAIGAWYSHVPLQCSSGGALSLTITPSAGARYYLIGPIGSGYTGSLGTDSSGAERPDSSPSCTSDRALAPCP